MAGPNIQENILITRFSAKITTSLLIYSVICLTDRFGSTREMNHHILHCGDKSTSHYLIKLV